MHFQVSCRKKTESELPDSSRLGFLIKFLAINFVSSDTEDNNSVENTIISLFELCFRFRRFTLLAQTKSSWKPWKWLRLDLMLTMRVIDISYNLNLLTFSTRIVIDWINRYPMKWYGILWCLLLWQVIGNWENNMIRIEGKPS